MPQLIKHCKGETPWLYETLYTGYAIILALRLMVSFIEEKTLYLAGSQWNLAQILLTI